MRILFDHNAPRQLRRHLVGHEVDEAGERGWAGLGNGALLDRADAPNDPTAAPKLMRYVPWWAKE